jgi:hypothetical protein
MILCGIRDVEEMLRWPPARARACGPAGGAEQADRVPMGSGGGKHVTIVRLAVFADRKQ